MIIENIHSIQWLNANKTSVRVIADVKDEGEHLTIATPYSDESIIWQWVKEFPETKIEEYIEVYVEEASIVDVPLLDI